MTESVEMTCMFNGTGNCANDGTIYPILCLPPPRPYPKASAARSAMLLPTCEDCSAKVTIENFLIEEARKKIATGFIMQGKIVPDFDRAWLEWGEVGDAMWEEVSGAVASTPRFRPS